VDWAIELNGVSKAFVHRRNPGRNLKVRVLGLIHSHHREQRELFWALRDVDLIVRRGECLGLIGSNGSGKSTLLRIIARIFAPTAGRVSVHGRVTPMIELGVGFHPDLSGRQNVYLNTSLYGLSRRETDDIYDAIVSFSELGEFMDLPVKNYSSGMYVRLGFSVAAHLQPDILLVDEVLAVGDERFQQKCLARMEEVRRRGTTIVLVSHDMTIVERMCDRACLLVRGHLDLDGEPGKVITRYREILARPSEGQRQAGHPSEPAARAPAPGPRPGGGGPRRW
jgi:ABC-2 type transport system ATP-binding protein